MYIRPFDLQLNTYKQEFEALYLSSFPKEERKSILSLYQHVREGHSQLYLIFDQTNEFAGLMETIFDQHLIVIEYLAIHPRKRQQQLGSKALHWLKGQYPHHNIVVEIEETLVESPDQILRLKRRNFYLKHNFHFINQTIQFFDIRLELMATNPQFTYQDYINPYLQAYGPDIPKKIYYLD